MILSEAATGLASPADGKAIGMASCGEQGAMLKHATLAARSPAIDGDATATHI